MKLELNKNNLIKYYIKENHSRKETALYFNVSESTIRNRLLEYNITKPKSLSRDIGKKTCLEKYGDKNYNNKEKQQETMFSKYGYKSNITTDDFKIKRRRTMLERYGVEESAQNKEIREKQLETNRKNHNGKLAWNSDKQKKTMLEKYGVEYSAQSPQLLEKIKTSNKKTSLLSRPVELFDKDSLKDFILDFIKINGRKPHYKDIALNLNIARTTINHYVIQYGLKDYIEFDTSYYEDVFDDFLKQFNIPYTRNDRTVISPKELDFYFPSIKLAIEINDIASHSSVGFLSYEGKPKTYHYEKSKACEEKGIRLIHIWEYEWNNPRQRPILENIIKSALGVTNRIYARNCNIVVKKSSDMKEFFNTNNIQGFRGGKFAICLEYKGEIVMSYLFGNCFFGKGKYQCEVIRGATKLGYTVVGGASKIWKYFISNYNYDNCVYYIDYNYFNGNSLKNLPEMEFIKTQPSFKNYWVKEGIVKNREPLKHKEIKSLIDKGLVLPIYNAGTKVYVWNRK